MSKKEEKHIWKKVNELRKKGLLPLPTEEDIKNEPSSLANSQYRNEELEVMEHLKEISEELDEILEGDLEEKEEDNGYIPMTFILNPKQVETLNKWMGHIYEKYGKYGNFEYRFKTTNKTGYEAWVYNDLVKTELFLNT